MAKILKIDLQKSIVSVGMDNGELIDVALSEFSFVPQEGQTVNVFKNSEKIIITEGKPAGKTSNQSENDVKETNKITYALLVFFFGWLGINKFYIGDSGAGIITILVMLLSLILLGLPTLIVTTIEFINALVAPADANGNIKLKKVAGFIYIKE